MIGQTLGHYVITSLLGKGGMGEVYRAADRKLGRDVAIKVLPDKFAADTDHVSRFQREAKLLASLNHPNIAAIHGTEEFGGTRFLVLELVEGETLADRIKAGPIPFDKSIKLAAQIADALGAAHEKGIIHRDLKPSNIKITPAERVKVLDFGLAKGKIPRADELSRTATISNEETIEGTVLGTIAYMSPEQARGKQVDKRTDIWSFGCVAFEMLSGKKPFDGPTSSDKIAAILSRDPDWRLLPKYVPDALRTMLQKCLQKDLEWRIGDIAEVRAVLDEVTAAGRRPLEIRWLGTIAAIGCLLVLLAFGIPWAARHFGKQQYPDEVHRAFQLPVEKHLVVLPFKELSGDPKDLLRAEGLSEVVSGRLAKTKGISVTPPAIVQGVLASETDLSKVAASVKANLFLTVSIERSLSQTLAIYSILSVSDKGGGKQVGGGTVMSSPSDFFALGEPLVQGILRDLRLPSTGSSDADLMQGLAKAEDKDNYLEALGLLGRYENESSLDNAIALLEELKTTVSNPALIELSLARAYFYKYDLSHQRVWADRAIDLCLRVARTSLSMPEVHLTLGLLRTRTGRPEAGIAEFLRALEQKPDWPEAVLGLAEAYEDARRFSDAAREYQRAIRLQPGIWSGYNKFGNFYFKQGQFQQASEMYQQVITLTPDNARAHYNLGAALQYLNRFDEARQAYMQSIAIRPSGSAYSNLGTLEYSLGRYKESAEANEKAVALEPDKSTLWANLGDAYRWTPGLGTKARPAYEKAIRLAKQELQLKPKYPLVQTTLALCLAKTGNCAGAQTHVREALKQNPNNSDNMFQAAVVATICKNRQEALFWVQEAVLHRYPVTALMREPELASLREDKEFQRALAGSARIKNDEKP